MKINKILIILTFFLLLSCGFEPIYSKKKLDNNYNFTILNIGFSGNNNINQYLKNNLTNYIDNEDKNIKYNLVIDSSIKKTISSKNKKEYLEQAKKKINKFLEKKNNIKSIFIKDKLLNLIIKE